MSEFYNDIKSHFNWTAINNTLEELRIHLNEFEVKKANESKYRIKGVIKYYGDPYPLPFDYIKECDKIYKIITWGGEEKHFKKNKEVIISTSCEANSTRFEAEQRLNEIEREIFIRKIKEFLNSQLDIFGDSNAFSIRYFYEKQYFVITYYDGTKTTLKLPKDIYGGYEDSKLLTEWENTFILRNTIKQFLNDNFIDVKLPVESFTNVIFYNINSKIYISDNLQKLLIDNIDGTKITFNICSDWESLKRKRVYGSDGKVTIKEATEAIGKSMTELYKSIESQQTDSYAAVIMYHDEELSTPNLSFACSFSEKTNLYRFQNISKTTLFINKMFNTKNESAIKIYFPMFTLFIHDTEALMNCFKIKNKRLLINKDNVDSGGNHILEKFSDEVHELILNEIAEQISIEDFSSFKLLSELEN